MRTILSAAVLLLAASVAVAEEGAGGATAAIKDAAGADVGTVTITETDEGLQVKADLVGLPPGVHGIHIHTVGKCAAPDFKSAGAHWNPKDMKHGLESPKGPHKGDLPNLTIAADGKGSLDYTMDGGTISGFETSLLDEDGSTIVVHAAADDMTSDPAGNSGDRIACGVFAESK